jgi:hypothetical protein
MDRRSIVIAAAAVLSVSDCDQDSAPSSPTTTATVRIVFMGSTVRRTDSRHWQTPASTASA